MGILRGTQGDAVNDSAIGLVAVLVGVLLALRGYPTMRAIISLFGAFVGFALGVTIAQRFTSGEPLSGPVGWIAGLIAAVVFGALAYAFYRFAIVLGMGGMGFTLGTSLMALLNVHQEWAIIGVGIVFGVLLAILAVVTDLPGLMIVVLTALTGADLVVGGARVLAGDVSLAHALNGTGNLVSGASWMWWALGVGVAVIGVLAQSRYLTTGRRRSASSQWARTGAARA